MTLSIDQPSTHERALHEIARRIKELGLPSLAADEVVVRRAPWNRQNVYRGISVVRVDWNESRRVIDREDVGYGCGVVCVVSDPQSSVALLSLPALWIERIRQHFIYDRLQNVAESGGCFLTCHVSPWDVRIPKRFEQQNLTAEGCVIRAWVREPRR